MGGFKAAVNLVSNFIRELDVFGGVPVHKKHEILVEGPDSLFFQGLPRAFLLYARALIGRTDRG